MSKTSKLVARTNTLVTCEHAYLRDDGRAVVLGPDRGRGTLVGSGALSVAPPTFSHPWWQQAWSTGGQLITARANQRDLSDLGWRQMSYYSSQRNQGLEEHFSVGSVFSSIPCFPWQVAELLLSPAVLHWQKRVSSPGGCSREERQIVRTPPKRQKIYCRVQLIVSLTDCSWGEIKLVKKSQDTSVIPFAGVWSNLVT